MKTFKEFLSESIWDSPEMFPKLEPTEDRKKFAAEIWTKALQKIWYMSMISMKRVANIRNVSKVPNGIVADIEDKKVKKGFKKYVFRHKFERSEFNSLSFQLLLPLDDNSKNVSEILQRNVWKFVKMNDAKDKNDESKIKNFGAVKQNIPEYINGKPFYLFHLKIYFKDEK